MRAIVMGGTGAIGKELLRALADDSAYASIVSLARRPHDAPARVRVEVVDTARFDLPEADVAFCALGTTMATAGSEAAFRAVDHELVVRFARACKARGVRGFHVVSALGADATSRTFYNRVKGEMERDLQAIGFERACAYRPSLLLTDREESRPAERAGIIVMRALGPLVPRRYRGITPRTVARAMARNAARDGKGWRAMENVEIARVGA